MATKRARKKQMARRQAMVKQHLGAAATMAAPIVITQVVESIGDKLADARARRDSYDRVRELRAVHAQIIDELATAKPWKRRALRREGLAVRQAIAAYRAGAENAAEFYARSAR